MESGNESIGQSTERDNSILLKRDAYFSSTDQSIDEILKNFPTYVRRVNVTRFLAHYELYKQIANLPGSIVELGVFKGASLFSFAHFLEIFNHGDRSRKVIGFDSFQGLGDLHPKDGIEEESHSKKPGGWKAKGFDEDLIKMIDVFSEESFVPQANRIALVKGDINQTVPEFVKKNPGLRISLLHFDCDLYEPTMTGLINLVPLMVPGGIVVFDEFAITAWAGETSAVEEYFGKQKRIEKFNWTTLPGGFIKL
jgi:hypothetical protein